MKKPVAVFKWLYRLFGLTWSETPEYSFSHSGTTVTAKEEAATEVKRKSKPVIYESSSSEEEEEEEEEEEAQASGRMF